MNKISEQDLILYHYGELPESERYAITQLLKSDKSVSDRYQALTNLLGTADEWKPAKPAEDFEQKVWSTINTEINNLQKSSKQLLVNSKTSIWEKISNWFSPGFYHPAPAFIIVLALVSFAYYSGRYNTHQDLVNDPTQLVASLSPETRDKILFQSVSEHLERSSRLLTTVSMTDSEQSTIASTEQKWARQLLISNRLFSKAAQQSGQWRIVSLLDELEPILIEMANSNDQSFSNRQQIQERIQDRKLVFKTKAFKAKQKNSI